MIAPPPSLRLQTTSDPANLAPVRRQIEAFCTARGFRDPALGEIVLCVNEAMTNITRHAYGGATDRPIEIEADFSQNQLRVSLRDWGNGKQPPGCMQEHDPLRPGGIGLLCLGKLMDQFTFTPQPDGMRLTMYRRL
jgi:serine/threonine-protein kinase RsbW